jgi:hypothetical protein
VATRNFVGSVFRDVGLPNTIVSDRNTRFTTSLRTALHAALGTYLIFGSLHHHNTTSNVECVNGVITEVAIAGNSSDNWLELVQLVEFAINDSASTLGSGYTQFYADRGQYPRTGAQAPLPARCARLCCLPGSGEVAAHLMARITAQVLALLQEQQDRRKAALDAHRRDVQLAVGDEVLLDTEHTPLPSRSLLSPNWQWMGPFAVLAQLETAPNTYLLDLPPAWRLVTVPRRSTWSACSSGSLPSRIPDIECRTFDIERNI